MKPTLIVLAAGLGSRYKGLKQVDAFGPSGESILDYTVYDAVKVGFGKIVFVIHEIMVAEFISIVEKKLAGKIEIEFVIQKSDDLPEGILVLAEREKPWGTAHAIWVTRNVVSTPFCLVNADDFYGRSALETMKNMLLAMNSQRIEACMVGYRLAETISNFGSVSRGVCEIENGKLMSITERQNIHKIGSEIIYKQENQSHTLSGNAIVSMNLMGFSLKVFSIIEDEFIRFLYRHKEELTSEFYAPSILQVLIEKGIEIAVSNSNSIWFGVTYPEDKVHVQKELKRLIDTDEYPTSLWDEV